MHKDPHKNLYKNPYKKKRYRMFISLCLIIAMAGSSFLPQTKTAYNVQAEENTAAEQNIEDNTNTDSNADTNTGQNASTDNTVPDNKNSAANTDNQTQQNTEAPVTSKILQADNAAQRKAQTEQKKEVSTAVKAELTAQTDFPEESKGKIEVAEGDSLDNLKKSLNMYLAKENKEIANVDLPLKIGFTDANGTELEKKESVAVKLSMEDEKIQ